METLSPIQRACAAVGGQARLAALLQVTPAVVHQWVHGIRRVPVERCTEIERATASVVTCEELRPDRAEHWAYLRSTSPKDGELAQPVGREAA